MFFIVGHYIISSIFGHSIITSIVGHSIITSIVMTLMHVFIT